MRGASDSKKNTATIGLAFYMAQPLLQTAPVGLYEMGTLKSLGSSPTFFNTEQKKPPVSCACTACIIMDHKMFKESCHVWGFQRPFCTVPALKSAHAAHAALRPMRPTWWWGRKRMQRSRGRALVRSPEKH